MARLLQHYRRARKGDVKCAQCAFYHRPGLFFKRGRCGTSAYVSTAVGKNHTCDAANSKEKRNDPKELAGIEKTQ